MRPPQSMISLWGTKPADLVRVRVGVRVRLRPRVRGQAATLSERGEEVIHAVVLVYLLGLGLELGLELAL